MKLSYLHSVALAGLLGCCSGSHADAGSEAAQRALILPVTAPVMVREVHGRVDYAYEGTGWKTLSPGKVLEPGATVRAGKDSAAVIRVPESAGFLRISPATRLHITLAAPLEEKEAFAFAVHRRNQ